MVKRPILLLVAAPWVVGCGRTQESGGRVDASRVDASGVDAAAASGTASDAAADVAPRPASIDVDAASWVATSVPVKLRPGDPCLVKCEKVATELACGNAEGCRDNCEKLRGAQFCAKQVGAFISCFVKQPKVRWRCENHLPSLDEACGEQQSAISDCLMRTGGKL
jgi:hypothetical protein